MGFSKKEGGIIRFKIKNIVRLYSVFKVIKKLLPKKKRGVIVKKGVATTEFWMTVIFDLLAIVMTVLGVVEPEVAAKIMLVLNGFYMTSRTLVKFTATDLDDKAVEMLKNKLGLNK